MKLPLSIAFAGIVVAAAIYAGLTDARRTYMTACVDMAMGFRQSAEEAERNCAVQYKPK